MENGAISQEHGKGKVFPAPRQHDDYSISSQGALTRKRKMVKRKKKTFEISDVLFRKQGSKNDRYALYKMLYHLVSFKDVSGKEVSGYVDAIYRDVFENKIEIKIGGKTYKFDEPSLMKISGSDLTFVYGSSSEEVSDEVLFDEMRKEQFRETVDDTVHRLAPKIKTKIKFKIGVKKVSRRKPLLKDKKETP